MQKKLLVDEINEPGTVVYVCVGREYAGYVLVQDQVKEEAKATLTWLKEKYRAILVMLTGDTEKDGTGGWTRTSYGLCLYGLTSAG